MLYEMVALPEIMSWMAIQDRTPVSKRGIHRDNPVTATHPSVARNPYGSQMVTRVKPLLLSHPREESQMGAELNLKLPIVHICTQWEMSFTDRS